MRAATRVRTVVGRPKFYREMVRPIYVSHRVGSGDGIGPYPENAAESMELLLGDGARMMNYDALQKTSDGVIVCIHDLTVDRTLTGTGNVSSMTLAAFKALRHATTKSWGPGFPDGVWPTHTFDEMVAQLGARGVHNPECNLAGMAAIYAASFISRGLQDYVQIMTADITNANAFAALGFSVLYLPAAGASVATILAAWPAPGHVLIDYSQASPPGGSIDAYVQALVTAGYKLHVGQVHRRADAAAAIASAVAAGGVLDAIHTNEPIYLNTRIWRPRTSDSFANGRPGHGTISGAGGPVPHLPIYACNRAGYGNDQTTGLIWFLLGEIAPLSRPFTLTFEGVVESLSSSASATMSGVLGAVDNAYNNSAGASRRDGYYWSYNVTSGLMSVFRNTGGGATQTSLGTKASAAPVMPLKLTADLAAGVAVTSLPVRAVPASIPAGTQFLLPTGQKVTTSGVTAANATTVVVASVTPTALVPAVTRAPQTIPFSLQLTPTQIILKRLDTGDTLTATDSTYSSPLYPFFGKQANSTTVTFADGATTAGSPVVTSPALAAFAVATDEDKLLTHANIPAGARILSVDSATQVTLTAPATASGSGLTMTLYRPNNGATYRNIGVGA